MTKLIAVGMLLLAACGGDDSGEAPTGGAAGETAQVDSGAGPMTTQEASAEAGPEEPSPEAGLACLANNADCTSIPSACCSGICATKIGDTSAHSAPQAAAGQTNVSRAAVPSSRGPGARWRVDLEAFAPTRAPLRLEPATRTWTAAMQGRFASRAQARPFAPTRAPVTLNASPVAARRLATRRSTFAPIRSSVGNITPPSFGGAEKR